MDNIVKVEYTYYGLVQSQRTPHFVFVTWIPSSFLFLSRSLRNFLISNIKQALLRLSSYYPPELNYHRSITYLLLSSEYFCVRTGKRRLNSSLSWPCPIERRCFELFISVLGRFTISITHLSVSASFHRRNTPSFIFSSIQMWRELIHFEASYSLRLCFRKMVVWRKTRWKEGVLKARQRCWKNPEWWPGKLRYRILSSFLSTVPQYLF